MKALWSDVTAAATTAATDQMQQTIARIEEKKTSYYIKSMERIKVYKKNVNVEMLVFGSNYCCNFFFLFNGHNNI